MKYTKEQLQGMSDLEINQVLTAMVLGNPWLEFGEPVNDGKEFHVANAIGDPFYCAVIDYCNNPSDIMPLAFEHGIDIKNLVVTKTFAATAAYDGEIFYIDKNPLRAIACCLILVLQDKVSA